jgi:site-specific DNA-methyltransferase (cytosine-N4-specific)
MTSQHQDALTSFTSTPTLDGYDWAFSGADTSYHMHGLMGYPARMPPQLPAQAIRYLKSSDQLATGDTLVDPFCGSGTTAPEARLANLDFHGIDINPLACQIARAKATPVSPDALAHAFNDVTNNWHLEKRFIDDAVAMERSEETDKDGEPDPLGAPVAVKKHWFPKPQVYHIDNLSRRLSEARAHHDYQTVRLLRLALGKTARIVSYQQPGEFKRQRISETDRTDHDPNVLDVFHETAIEFYEALDTFHEAAPQGPDTTVTLGDNRDQELLPTNYADAILTSPPYGDSRTTVAYGQFSNIPANAATPLSYAQMRAVDTDSLGGSQSDSFSDMDRAVLRDAVTSLDETLTQLEAVDGRHHDALDFIADYAESLAQMARVCKPGQPTILVVGNRTMSRVSIPLHHITAELAVELGFTHEETVSRTIPSKTLPYANAPENVPGETGEMMADEYIIELTAPESQQRV